MQNLDKEKKAFGMPPNKMWSNQLQIWVVECNWWFREKSKEKRELKISSRYWLWKEW